MNDTTIECFFSPQLAQDSPAGFWVCSCHWMITIPHDTKVDWSDGSSVRLFTVPQHISKAANQHGVAKINQQVTTVPQHISKAVNQHGVAKINQQVKLLYHSIYQNIKHKSTGKTFKNEANFV